ncbi:MAG: DUF885 domain-containing protein [Eubacterium sp.]|nr:DUF885 domain-containing protein [Eubacterium sp.]
MRKLKKTVALVLVSLMMLSGTSCGKGDDNAGKSTRQQNIIATIQRDNDKTTEKTTAGSTENTSDKTTEDTASTTEQPSTEKPGSVNADAEKAFKEFEDDMFKDEISSNFFNYHFTLKDGSKYGIERPAASWGEVDWSDEAVEKSKKEAKEQYDRLCAIDRNGLNETDQFSYDVYKEDIELSMEMQPYMLYDGDFSPMRGIQSDFANKFTDYPFYEKQDVEDYVILLETSRDYIDKLLEFEKERAEKGYALSDYNLDDVIDQCNTFVKDGENHFLIEVFDNAIADLDFLTDEEKQTYKDRNKKAIIDVVIPAFNDIADTMSGLKGKAKTQLGYSYYDNGQKFYELKFKQYTGSTKTPDEAIAFLESRATEIVQEMSMIYMSDPDGYQEYVDNYGNHLADADKMNSKDVVDILMETAMDDYPELPAIPYTVSYLDKTLETIMDSVLAYYRSPALDMPSNNIIKVNGGHLDGQWATLAHEGCPGHMYQNTYYMSTNPSNLRAVDGFLGYMEGWAKYAEYGSYLAYDFPNTEHDETIGRLSALESEYNMLFMGYIDLRVNYSGWTVEDVATYMAQKGFNSSAAEKMVNLFAGDPAAYQSYVIGYYEMKGLRDKAEQALGDKFDPVEFHRVILENGPCQYDILTEKVDEFIDENK